MGRIFRGIVGAVKDTASLSKVTLLSSSSAAELAVLRATPHQPSSEPPDPRHLAALLAFGHGSRVAAAACVSALAARLCSIRDPAVALKSLLALHHLLARGAFILRDQLLAALLRQPASGRNPLALPASAFPSAAFPLASWARWLARLLELLLVAAATTATFPSPQHHHVVDPHSSNDRLASLLNRDLLMELDALVAVVEEIARAPVAAAAVKGNKLISEAVRLVEEYRVTAEQEILVRTRELGERVGYLGFADSVELVCLLRRLEECKDRADRPSDGRWTDDDWFWLEVRELEEQADKVVVRKEEEEERRRVRREKLGSSSARIMDRVPSGPIVPVRFSSSRWVDR